MLINKALKKAYMIVSLTVQNWFVIIQYMAKVAMLS